MATVEIPAGARYVVVHCTPAGDATTSDTLWDDATTDAATALAMLQAAMPGLAEATQKVVMDEARKRLMAPLPAEPPVVAEAGHEERVDLGGHVGGDEPDGT